MIPLSGLDALGGIVDRLHGSDSGSRRGWIHDADPSTKTLGVLRWGRDPAPATDAPVAAATLPGALNGVLQSITSRRDGGLIPAAPRLGAIDWPRADSGGTMDNFQTGLAAGFCEACAAKLRSRPDLFHRGPRESCPDPSCHHHH